MSRLGIIPAAGRGTRWGSYIKELLPTGTNRFLLDDCIDTLKNGGCDRFCIITNPEKAGIISQHVGLHCPNIDVFYVIDTNPQSMWGSLKLALPFCEKDNLMMMPDTVVPPYAFKGLDTFAHIQFGTFTTTTPERFSVFDGPTIVCKNKAYTGRTMEAWGLVAWTKQVSNFWLDKLNEIEDYDHAFNMALNLFSSHKFHIPWYYDNASWPDYAQMLRLYND